MDHHPIIAARTRPSAPWRETLARAASLLLMTGNGFTWQHVATNRLVTNSDSLYTLMLLCAAVFLSGSLGVIASAYSRPMRLRVLLISLHVLSVLWALTTLNEFAKVAASAVESTA